MWCSQANWGGGNSIDNLTIYYHVEKGALLETTIHLGPISQQRFVSYSTIAVLF